MTQQIKLRRDIAVNWTTNNPTLGQGEIGIETDNLGLAIGSSPTWLNNGSTRYKIGDGQHSWTQLPYSVFVTDGLYAGSQTSSTPGVISFGSGLPTNTHGSTGDIYINATGGLLTTIYQFRSTGWVGIV